MFGRLSLPLALLPIAACVGDFECNPIFGDCRTNADCREDQQCRNDPDSFDSFCRDATFCATDADCPSSEVCETRPDEAPQNPFDTPTPREPWCVCNGFDCPLGGAPQGGFDGSGGAGGSPFGVGGAGGNSNGGGGNSNGGGNGGAP